MAATTQELRQQLAAKRVRSRSAMPVNQYASAPAAPAAPPATVSGLATAAQTVDPAANALAGATTPAAPTPVAALAAAAPAAPEEKKLVAPTSITTTQRVGPAWQGPGPSPFDAIYYADVAKLNSDINIEETQLDLEQVHRQGAHDTSRDEIAHQNALSTVATRQQNARGGIGYSTQGGNAIGEVEHNFAVANAANNADYDNWVQAANITRQALEQGFTVDEAAARGAAVYRKSQEDAPLPAAAPAGAPASNATNPVFKTGGAGPPGPNYVWDASRSQWTPTGPPPGPGYQFDPTARKWVKTGSPPGAGYRWDFARNRWVK